MWKRMVGYPYGILLPILMTAAIQAAIIRFWNCIFRDRISTGTTVPVIRKRIPQHFSDTGIIAWSPALEAEN